MTETEMNPFITGSAVKEDLFFNREELLSNIDNFLYHSNDATFILYGQRRIGKTSLLRHIQEKILRKKGKVTLFDFQNKADFELPRLLTNFIEQISADFHLEIDIKEVIEKHKDIEEFFKNDFLSSLTGQFEKKEKMVLLFDEFDVIGSYVETLENSVNKTTAHHRFLPYMIDVLQNGYPIKCIFAVGCNYKDLDLSRYKELIKFGKKEVIDYFSREKLGTMIQSLTKDTLSFSIDAIDILYELTAGQPYFSQCLASCAFNKACSLGEKEVTPQIVQNQLETAIHSYGGGVIWLWDSFSAEEKILLYLMADVSNNKSTLDARAINDEAVRKNAAPAVRNLHLIINKLINLKIIKKKENDSFVFYVEYFRKWILKEILFDDIMLLLAHLNTGADHIPDNMKVKELVRQDKNLSEKSFLELIKKVLTQLPIIRKLTGTGKQKQLKE